MPQKFIMIIIGAFAAMVLFGFLAINRLETDFHKNDGACTMEAKLCPDGSAVGRTGPNCTFAECPGAASVPAQPPVTSPTPTVSIVPYGKVTLGISQTANFDTASVTLVRVFDDSRCPSDVTCIWAGTLRAELFFKSSGGSWTETVEMGKPLHSGGLSVTLLSATPYPRSGEKIDISDYKLVFEIAPKTVTTTSPTPTTTVVVVPPAGTCYVGGCSGEVCSDRADVASNCIYRPEFQCYKAANCERQASGDCGWTETATLRACLLSPENI